MVKGLLALARRLRGEKESSEGLFFRKVLAGSVRAGFTTIALTEGVPVQLGREASSDLRLDSRSVDDRHAQMKLEDGRVWICDLGSRRGTRINGRAATPRQWVPVRSSDKLYLGEQEVVLELELEPLPAGNVAPSPSTAVSATVPESRRTTSLLEDRATAILQGRATNVLEEWVPDVAIAPARPAGRTGEVAKLSALVGVPLLVIFLASLIFALAGPKPPPVVKLKSWKIFGTVSLAPGSTDATMTIHLPEGGQTFRQTYKVGEHGDCKLEYDLKLDTQNPPTRVDIGVEQGGKVVSSAKGLRLPPPGGFLHLPPLRSNRGRN